MKIWSFVNQNPRTGKTQAVSTLAELLINRGDRVLMVDLDPQGTLTSGMELNPTQTSAGAYTLFRNAIEKPVSQTMPQFYACRHPKLSLLPASTAMAAYDDGKRLGGGLGVVLKTFLESVSNRFDYVLVDSAPVIGMLMVNALAAADAVVVPAPTEAATLSSVEPMLQMMTMINKSRAQPAHMLLVPNRFDRRSRASIQALRAMRQQYGQQIWRSAIPNDPLLRQYGKPNGPAKPTRGVLEMRRLLEDLDAGAGRFNS